MYQGICVCEKPTIDKRFQYGTVTTVLNDKKTKYKVLNPVQYCGKCGGIITSKDKSSLNDIDNTFAKFKYEIKKD